MIREVIGIEEQRIDSINKRTKEAWDENCKDIKIETIIEIFEYPRPGNSSIS